MKLESFLAINGVYLMSFLPISATILLFIKFKLKKRYWMKSDIWFIFGGLIYWFFYEFTAVLKGKSLGGIIIELICIGLSCAFLFLLRSTIGLKIPNKNKTFSLLCVPIIVFIVLCVGILMPDFPE